MGASKTGIGNALNAAFAVRVSRLNDRVHTDLTVPESPFNRSVSSFCWAPLFEEMGVMANRSLWGLCLLLALLLPLEGEALSGTHQYNRVLCFSAALWFRAEERLTYMGADDKESRSE